MEKDVKTGSYNVLKLAFGSELGEFEKSMLKSAMLLELDAMSKRVEKIDFSSHRDVEAIIKNVIFDGLVKETDRVLSKKTKKEKRQEKKKQGSNGASGE